MIGGRKVFTAVSSYCLLLPLASKGGFFLLTMINIRHIASQKFRIRNGLKKDELFPEFLVIAYFAELVLRQLGKFPHQYLKVYSVSKELLCSRNYEKKKHEESLCLLN